MFSVISVSTIYLYMSVHVCVYTHCYGLNVCTPPIHMLKPYLMKVIILVGETSGR